MANITQVLNEEIRRLAKKATKSDFDNHREQLVALRRSVGGTSHQGMEKLGICSSVDLLLPMLDEDRPRFA